MVRRRNTTLAAIAIAAAAAAFVTACGGGVIGEADELPFARINATGGTSYPVADYVVRTAAEWQFTWGVYHAGRNPVPALPSIDFTQRMVLGAARGSGPNGCYGLRIVRVREEPTRVRVDYVIEQPAPGTPCTQAIVPLADFVSVPRVEKLVVFAEVPR